MGVNDGRPMSETMRDLLTKQVEVHARSREVDEEVKRASIAEAAALCDYKLAHSVAYLAAEGSAATRTAVADRDTIALLRGLEIARALRRSAMEASSTLHHAMDAHAAQNHAYNRELKTELELAGAGGGR